MNMNKQSGFTILEVLIVIVIIGILATITIVSYTSVTARTNDSSAKQAAQAAASKFERYYSLNGSYPQTTALLTTDSTKEYYLASDVASFNLSNVEPPTTISVKFLKCGTTPNTSQSTLTTAAGNYTGGRVYYWTYSGTPNANNYVSFGNDSGPGVACPTS